MNSFIFAILPLIVVGIMIIILVNSVKKKNINQQDNKENVSNEEGKVTQDNISIGMSLGMCFGVAIGSAFTNIFGTQSIVYGICFGMLGGMLIAKNK